MANQWFKFYGGEYLGDQKIFGLTACERSCWVTLLCFASQTDGVVRYLSEEQLMLHAGVNFQDEEWERTKGVLERFKKLGMIVLRNGIITVKNWQKRQETNLTNAERQARFRERHKESNEPRYEDVTKVTLEENRREKNRQEKNREREERGSAEGDAGASLTPKGIAKEFFENQGKQQEVIANLMAKGIPEDLARGEVTKFILYWTELNPTGKKQRWEKQETFEVMRRLTTWFNNIRERQQSKFKGKQIIT